MRTGYPRIKKLRAPRSDCRFCGALHLRRCPIGELARLGRTLHAWRVELYAHLEHPDVSNGLTENLNLKIKNTKRVARGYRNFNYYQLRLLLNHGRIREDHSPTRIRTRAPTFAA
jgi:transposase